MSKFCKALSYDDVLLVPQYSEIESRQNTNTFQKLNNVINFSPVRESFTFSGPIIASPMDTISELEMAKAMREVGCLAILHRFCTTKKQVSMVEQLVLNEIKNSDWYPIAAAVGVSGDFFERTKELKKAGVSIICIDIAHGHHVLMEKAIKKIRDAFGNEIHIMAGNIATPEGLQDLAKWGADSIRCGIGGGSICSTRIQTGHGIPTFQTILDCASLADELNVQMIADGGIRYSGDIVKALAAGADFIMVGSLLAGAEQAPGKCLETKDGIYKVYRGMASAEAQEDKQFDKISTIYQEGISTQVPYIGDVKRVIEDLKKGIKSGLSYTGVENIKSLQMCAKFVEQTNAGREESFTHILTRR